MAPSVAVLTDLEVELVIQVLVDLLGITVLPQEPSQHTQPAHPQDLGGQTCLTCTPTLTCTRRAVSRAVQRQGKDEHRAIDATQENLALLRTVASVSALGLGLLCAPCPGSGVNLGWLLNHKAVLDQLPDVLSCTQGCTRSASAHRSIL